MVAIRGLIWHLSIVYVYICIICLQNRWSESPNIHKNGVKYVIHDTGNTVDNDESICTVKYTRMKAHALKNVTMVTQNIYM